MSYDLRIAVKVDGCDKFAQIAEPEYSSPTYNLGKMFRACTGWNYKQGEYYKCSDVIGNIEKGVKELRANKAQYKQYEPEWLGNGCQRSGCTRKSAGLHL